ncbi:hypothetical protein [Mesorhizobium sp. M0633]|uniref:hypothetical protein n=1 Tax=Mesorhizobium sp. M0633 TaxID=2956977 RepID=UPI00333B9833
MAGPSAADPTQTVEVTYHKSNHFRVVLAEGCFGGVTPRGLITSSFYNERVPIPKTSKFEIVDGKPAAEQVTKSLEGLVREVEVEVVMDLNTAIAYYIWLRDKLENIRSITGISDADWAVAMGNAK